MTNTVTIVGNVTDTPELRFISSGAAVTTLTIAQAPRVKNAAGQWEDGDPMFIRCNLWRQLAEHAADSLTKGARVIATGKLKQRSFETKTGEKRSVVELDVEDLGPSLKFVTASVGRKEPKGDPWGTSDDNPPF